MTESLIGFFSFYLRARNSNQSKSEENVNKIIVFHAQVIFLLTGQLTVNFAIILVILFSLQYIQKKVEGKK